jgi:glycerol uptake facilitator-like aquaporin
VPSIFPKQRTGDPGWGDLPATADRELPIENCRSKGNAVDSRLRIGIAEAIGTMILVVGGAGTAILATGTFFPKGSFGIIGVALAFGVSLLVAAYSIGSISGCHVNPAVTLGLLVIGKTKTKELPFYIVFPVVGGILGGALWRAIRPPSDELTEEASEAVAPAPYGRRPQPE